MKELLQGIYSSNERGFGFVKIGENSSDIFIAKENSNSAMDGDKVSLALIEGKKRGDHLEGKIIKVLKRNIIQVVGTFKKSKNFGFIIPDDKKITGDIFVSRSKWGKAKNNEKVVAKITKYPEKNRKAEGQIIEVLGNKDEAGIDMLSIVKAFRLPNEFPQDVIDEAKKKLNEEITPKGRLDLRNKEMFTIDGEDAKDLDDAVFVEKNENGTYLLGVNIADVSHYVKDGSKLDKEAILRGTSVYMLDRVIPMLPKELSNDICSLNQGKDRYCLSCIITIDKEGNVIDSDIKKSIIRVTERMNYHDVFDIIERRNDKILKKYEKYRRLFIIRYSRK